MWQRLAVAGALVTSIGTSIPVSADVDVVVRIAPPAARVEVVPAPRVGYAWAPGHWAWRDGRHVWIGGVWIRERPGMHWHPSRWVHRDGQWRFVSGGWAGHPYVVRDRDGDGVRNRKDARPHNPNRR